MKKNSGFTLVELMIVVAIVSILTLIAYPSYQSYVMKSKRSDAYSGLSQAVSDQEKFFSMNNTYRAQANPFAGTVTITSPEGYYNISVAIGASGTTFRATATAVAGGAQAGDTCNGFSVTNTGLKAVSSGTMAECWP